MNGIHGIIACAGNGSRFAQSVGKISPFPKHLEMVGDKSVLNYAFEGLVHNIPVESVTFTLNPLLQERYIDHLHELQSEYPNIALSYAPAREIPGARLFTNIQETLRHGVIMLDGREADLGNPIAAIALGDSVITQGNRDALKQDIDELLPHIVEGKSFAIFRDPQLKGLMYWLSAVSELSDGDPHFSRNAHDYDLRWWNCNTREELLIAQRELGYYPVENELNSLNYHPGKEAW